MKFISSLFVSFAVSLFLIGLFVWRLLGPVSSVSKPGVYVHDTESFDVSGDLASSGYIKSANAFGLLFFLFAGDKTVEPGGYRLDTAMNAWQVMQKISSKPDLVWVSMREGLRKEQVGEILAEGLGWDASERMQWNNLYTVENKPEYAEGVYFPDRYLIPRDESVAQIAQRFIDRFNEKFAPFQVQFTEKNIQWTTGLKIASLIQREAGGSHDMKLISGIIWKRLDIGMRLEIDAALQYLHGKNEDRWWGKIDLADKQSGSPYNLYRVTGLPPTPIANPGLAAIEAALNPEETDCIFYLHDPSGQIHCSVTYDEHLLNIKKYL